MLIREARAAVVSPAPGGRSSIHGSIHPTYSGEGTLVPRKVRGVAISQDWPNLFSSWSDTGTDLGEATLGTDYPVLEQLIRCNKA